MADKKVPLYRLKLIGYVENWFMGHDYMRGVSRHTAKTLTDKLPEVGWEKPVASNQEGVQAHQLMLQNVSGTYVLACSTAKVELWESLFPFNFTYTEN